jgi:hypothetical protein
MSVKYNLHEQTIHKRKSTYSTTEHIELYEDIFVEHIQQNPSMLASKEKFIYIPRIKLKFHSCFARHIKLVDKLITF